MATNKITVMLEALGFDKGTSEVKGFRQSIADADGTTGKFKAGATSAFDSIKANAGPALLGAGAALVAFGVNAVGAFTDTAKAAIDMGAATGLAVEDASRWIAVGDDFGVSAEQMTAGIGKIAKSLDDEKWSKYGIATRDAAGQARNANDILIDSLAMLGRVTNETDRARIGNELFGKGYSNLAPIVGKTAAEYKTMLGAVEDGQVITTEEAAKAERMRLAQDALSDALGEVTLALGEMVAEMAPAIEQVAQMVGWMTKLSDIHIPGLPKEFNLMTGQITYAQEALKVLTNHIDTKVSPGMVAFAEKARAGNEVLQRQREDAVAAAYGVGEYAYQAEVATGVMESMTYQQDRAAESTRDMARAAVEAKTAHDEFTKSLSNEESLISVQRLLDEFPGKLAAIDQAEKDGAINSEEAHRQRREAVLQTKDEVFKYLTEVQKIPPERATAIVAELDWGSVAGVESEIDFLARTRDAYINVHSTYDGGAGKGGGQLKQTASGAPLMAGDVSRVNDGGRPEMWVNDRGEQFMLAPSNGHVVANPNVKPVSSGVSIVMHNQISQLVDVDAMAQRLNFLLAS